ncbi:hypothetical protein C7974DRAFT_406071 [Boeremia exigua]|uniref:uncharacterized protein n=1 Tax=Boeremia exigua TaxID=749465 RepID=UPI001E8D0351|nr:uncharacterized protein C7974DRAFT_406071 [Boeremia exigua]KAH6612669.1 hypothetical protein C7974DRAFT_406071 [Boeremia exigua]
MDPKASLFARARPRVSVPKRKKGANFLTLSGEIRNKIYQHYFQDTYRCELVGEGCDFSAPMTFKLVSYIKVSEESRRESPVDDEHEKPIMVRFSRPGSEGCSTESRVWLNPHGAIILVSRQVHQETLSLLYQRTTFVFQAPRRIASFLHKVPKPNHLFVTNLHLHYATYGSPGAACDVVWQEKHLESWTRVCKSAAKSLTSLRELHIDLWINECAPKFDLRQKWLQPLLEFRRPRPRCTDHEELSTAGKALREPRTLVEVQVIVYTHFYAHSFDSNVPLAAACKHLHRLFAHGIGKYIYGWKERNAMRQFDRAWNEDYYVWQHHLGFASTGW